MPRVLCGIKTWSCNALPDHEGDCLARKPSLLNVPMPVDRPEQRPLSDICGSHPCVNRGNGTPAGPAMEDANLRPLPLLVCFGTAQTAPHTLAHVLDITDVQSDQLGASEPTHETDQQQGSVAHSLDISAVAEGIGVATVIDEGFFPEDRIVKLKSDGPPLASIVDVVYLANRRSNPLIADFIDMAKEIQHGG